ncbi:hypothetical protein A7E78_05575 [Syntrophotalea acetylenivorans]|uniref:Uncharacterized protein n=1 Tax=Syntrophotalea acetylenivorans TaxID=1842532 RepID=A0A1L3GN42_9BACT|nr:hypothetical protein [Syntrophotalea acetylenivorans]APG27357.1 hypothetical protein A7E78_05575 [Syntrophotalea acetylenivorans]
MTICAGQWQKHLHTAVIAFRLGMEGMAGGRMTGFIDGLLPCLDEFPPQIMQKLNPLLEKILSAHARQDFCCVADLLQYELGPILADRASPDSTTRDTIHKD